MGREGGAQETELAPATGTGPWLTKVRKTIDGTDYKHEVSLVIDILTGAVIEPDEASRKRVPAKTLRAILEVISAKREEAVFFWNEFTDGREIDLNAAWKQTDFIPDVAAAQNKASPSRHKDSTPI